jgi:hypothetical protein
MGKGHGSRIFFSSFGLLLQYKYKEGEKICTKVIPWNLPAEHLLLTLTEFVHRQMVLFC